MSKIAVIGSGTMGNGIAHVFAQHGHDVSLIDVNAAALEKAKATIASNDEGFLVAPLSAGFPLNASFLVSIISSPLKIDI